MYIIHKCSKCNKYFLLLNDDLIEIRKSIKEIYIVCPYCSSRKVTVSNKYDDLKKCLYAARVYKREKGRIQQVR